MLVLDVCQRYQFKCFGWLCVHLNVLAAERACVESKYYLYDIVNM